LETKANFILKVTCLFMSIDDAIGGQFEQGSLANLDAASRASASAAQV
jgi:hypothetical protein